MTYKEPVISSRAAPIFRFIGSRRSLMMKRGNTKSARSVPAFIQAVARKKAFRSMQEPVVILKSQYFAIGWHTHKKPKAARTLYMTEIAMTT